MLTFLVVGVILWLITPILHLAAAVDAFIVTNDRLPSVITILLPDCSAQALRSGYIMSSDDTTSSKQFPDVGTKRSVRLGRTVGLSVLYIAGLLALGYGIGFRDEAVSLVALGLVGVSSSFAVRFIRSDVGRVADCTTWSPRVGLWTGIGALVPPIATALYVRKRNEAIFRARAEWMERRVSTVETDVRSFLRYDDFLTHHRHQELSEELETLSEHYSRFKADVPSSTFDVDPGTELFHYLLRINTIFTALEDRDRYNQLYVGIELARQEDFFDAVGGAGTTLSERQRMSIVRNDTYNRVVAGAGTGKTLVLTTRTAYLIDKKDVAPESILVVTFTNEAANEMERRLREEFGISDVEVTTTHSFGYRVIRDLRGQRPAVFGTEDTSDFVSDVMNEDDDHVPQAFYRHLHQFLLYHELPNVDETDFETKAEYVEFLSNKRYETLRGETVNSRAEKLIADFLHTHQVEYQYESLADWAETGDERGAYRPDFYLPEHDVYVEHFGIDESGEVAEWFGQSTGEYVSDIFWKREEFSSSEHELVETYQFEYDTGRLKRAVRHRLSLHGIPLERMSHRQLVEETYELHEKGFRINELFEQFIANARTFGIAPDEIPGRLTKDLPRQYHFGHAGGLLLWEYERKLDRKGMIDFSDMIFGAADAITDGRADHGDAYRHVLVDEFQDVSINQFRLIEGLVGPRDGRLFAVGDDWQSIYSFQGAVVDLFIGFERRVGPSTTTRLPVNYRCPPEIVQASTELIRNNENQLEKDVESASETDSKILEHQIGGYSASYHVEYTATYAVRLIEQYIANGSDPDDVMVLCRYDDAVRFLDAVRRKLREAAIPYRGNNRTFDPDQNGDQLAGAVEIYSVHQAKGREAKHVIVLNASEGAYGFPATNRDQKLLEPVRDVETNTIAEERRLFYVAMTRSTSTVDLLVDPDERSRFVQEIGEFVESVPIDESLVAADVSASPTTIEAKVTQLWDDTHPKIHQAGLLDDHTDSIRFVSWASNEPQTLIEGSWYRFHDVRIDEYNGDPQVKLKSYSEVEVISEQEAQMDVQAIRESF